LSGCHVHHWTDADWAIKNPFTGLLLVSVINYATAKAHAAQVLASHNLVWVSLVLVLWFAVAAAEAHLCLSVALIAINGIFICSTLNG
jgi:hypothetical protein